MARRKPQPRRDDSPTADIGPSALVKRGLRVVVNAPDPDNPNRTLKRAQNRVVYNDWWAEGLLSHAQREAADRLAVQWEVSEGHCVGDGVSGSKGARSHPPLRILQATRDVREARQAMRDEILWADVLLVVINNADLGASEAPYIAGGLQKLVSFWGME